MSAASQTQSETDKSIRRRLLLSRCKEEQPRLRTSIVSLATIYIISSLPRGEEKPQNPAREILGNHRRQSEQAGWSWGCISAVDYWGRRIFVADAHRHGRRFIVRADEKLVAFLELEISDSGRSSFVAASASYAISPARTSFGERQGKGKAPQGRRRRKREMIFSLFLVWLIINGLVGYGIGKQKGIALGSHATVPPAAIGTSIAHTAPATRAAETPTASPTDTPEPTKTPEETPTPKETPTPTPTPS
jgi:hypothetical protein